MKATNFVILSLFVLVVLLSIYNSQQVSIEKYHTPVSTDLTGQYCTSSVNCYAPNFSIGTSSGSVMSFKGFIIFKNNNHEMIFRPSFDSQGIFDFEFMFYDKMFTVTPNNVKRYVLNGNEYTTTKTGYNTPSSIPKLRILDPNPYDFNFDYDGDYPVYLTFSTSNHAGGDISFDLVYASTLRWNDKDIAQVMNSYRKPISLNYKGSNLQDHYVVLNPNSSAFVDMTTVTTSNSFNSNDYRHSNSHSWNPKRPTMMRELKDETHMTDHWLTKKSLHSNIELVLTGVTTLLTSISYTRG